MAMALNVVGRVLLVRASFVIQRKQRDVVLRRQRKEGGRGKSRKESNSSSMYVDGKYAN